MRRTVLTCAVVICIFASDAIAQDGAAANAKAGEVWYKVATGVLAIPAALLGLILTFNILRKTTLESRKLELEIQQKHAEVRAATAGEVTLQTLASPVVEGQRVLLLIVRFVVLELTLRLWNVVPAAVRAVTGIATNVGLFAFRDRLADLDTSSWSFFSAALIAAVLRLLFDVVYWSIVFGFGWPLLRDTCSYLNIPLRSLWDLPFAGRWHRNKPAS